MRRSLLAAVGAAGMLVLFAPTSAANAPTTTSFKETVSFELDGICTFPLALSANFAGTQTDFYDQTEALVRVHIHANEQDTLSAHGITVVGEPYAGNIDLAFDNGVLVGAHIDSLFEKLKLPNGVFFISAGRADVLAGNGPVPSADKGNPGDVASLCAAFAADSGL